MMLNFDELWKRLNDCDETIAIEAKTASQMGPSLLETISAFSNEPGREGGYLLLGVQIDPASLFPSYEVVGVPNADKVQADLATQCRQNFNRPIRPEINVESRNGKKIVIAFIPEAQSNEKPIFIESRGLPKGAFRRIGSTDQKCTEDDLAMLYQSQSHHSYDETVLPEADLSDFDSAALAEYRRARKEANPQAPELTYTDEELLYALSCTARHKGEPKPTLAGMMLFGRPAALRRLFPMMRVDYIRVPGREWVPSPDQRFESIDMLGPLMQIIPRAINAILDDIPKAFRLPPNSDQRTDLPLIPRTAIREAVVNALMHRSYRLRSPVQIIRYSNRLEIRNPGHSLVPDDRLGEPGSITRNERIAAVLHETRYAETKGSGIRAMRESLTAAGLTPPTFESDREKDAFVVTFLFHHFLNPEDMAWLGQFADLSLTDDEAKALIFAREVGAINNAAYRDINRVETLVASGHLRRLRDAGLFEQKGKAAGTYYVPTTRLLTVSTSIASSLTDKVPPPTSVQSQGLTPVATAQPTGFRGNLQGLPTGLAEAVVGLGLRASPQEMRSVIQRLCDWKPLSSVQLSQILGRNQHHLLTSLLRPMLRDGELAYTIPDSPAHPQQAYRTPDRRTKE